MPFQDRRDAGQQLARQLLHLRAEEPLVLGLPRGGVPVAFEVARELEAPLDIWVVRKVGAPFQPELGLGAVAEDGSLYLNHSLIAMTGASEEEVAQIAERKAGEVQERVRLLRGGHPPPDVRGRTVIVVDDGIATGGTMRVALRSLRARGPRKLVLAVPVAATESLDSLRSEVDEVVCVEPTEYLMAIGAWYVDFRQTTEQEVLGFLEEARRARGEQPPATEGPPA